MKKLTNKKGFTLTELIVVIAIIAILSAVLIPALTGYIGRARQSAFEQEVDGITTVVDGYVAELASAQTTDTFEAYYQEITGNELPTDITITGVYTAAVTGESPAPAEFVLTFAQNGQTNVTYTLTGDAATALGTATHGIQAAA